ncbi:hypothetical protein M409DRAFT_60416 [Zasmidium cellare ATCC 36951]|uniref:Uncharacterized protein n=1 Tax=Zasmidium cellare ATCC 36951 TaxID=1080233 RepID=A0A6A6C3P6_ZASCE|nr:uncharacterized protein M409DRAFT_60416 [Zasmidium cellare ATCC 36951]KAF2160016.1 hypothetical protein M409DRAFT_60416 [Zasmidium cellare ATCC 36951]
MQHPGRRAVICQTAPPDPSHPSIPSSADARFLFTCQHSVFARRCTSPYLPNPPITATKTPHHHHQNPLLPRPPNTTTNPAVAGGEREGYLFHGRIVISSRAGMEPLQTTWTSERPGGGRLGSRGRLGGEDDAVRVRQALDCGLAKSRVVKGYVGSADEKDGSSPASRGSTYLLPTHPVVLQRPPLVDVVKVGKVKSRQHGVARRVELSGESEVVSWTMVEEEESRRGRIRNEGELSVAGETVPAQDEQLEESSPVSPYCFRSFFKIDIHIDIVTIVALPPDMKRRSDVSRLPGQGTPAAVGQCTAPFPKTHFLFRLLLATNNHHTIIFMTLLAGAPPAPSSCAYLCPPGTGQAFT